MQLVTHSVSSKILLFFVRYMAGVDRFLLGGGCSITPLLKYIEKENPEISDGAHDLSLTVTYFCDTFWLNFAKDVAESTNKNKLEVKDFQ